MRHILRQHLRHKVIVNLKDGQAFSGVLFAADGDALLLRNTTGLGMAERGENIPVDGEVLILRADVAFVQIP